MNNHEKSAQQQVHVFQGNSCRNRGSGGMTMGKKTVEINDVVYTVSEDNERILKKPHTFPLPVIIGAKGGEMRRQAKKIKADFGLAAAHAFAKWAKETNTGTEMKGRTFVFPGTLLSSHKDGGTVVPVVTYSFRDSTWNVVTEHLGPQAKWRSDDNRKWTLVREADETETQTETEET